MATQPLPDLPEGFEALSKEEQIEYVQSLWDQIASSEEDVPVPDWHRDVIKERLESRSPEQDSSWTDVKERLIGERDD